MRLPDTSSISRLRFRHAATNGATPPATATRDTAAFSIGSILASLATASILNRTTKKQRPKVVVVEKPPKMRRVPGWAKWTSAGLAIAGIGTAIVLMRRRQMTSQPQEYSGWAPSGTGEHAGEGIVSIRPAGTSEQMPDVPTDQPLETRPVDDMSTSPEMTSNE